MVKVRVVPLSVPDTVPVPRPKDQVAIDVPDTTVPDCSRRHVTCSPGPNESEASPENVPVKLSGVGEDGAVGRRESPPQPTDITMKLSANTTAVLRVASVPLRSVMIMGSLL